MLALINSLENLGLLERRPGIEGSDITASIQLPHELIEIIFHFAATDSKDFCYNIWKLSTWSRALAQRHLFVTLIITNPRSHYRALQFVAGNILHHPSKLIPGAVVQNIWIHHLAESFICIFENCPNLRNLAIYCYMFARLAKASSRSALISLSEEAKSRKQELHLFFITNSGPTANLFQTAEHSFIFPKITRLQYSWTLDYRSLHIPSFRLLTHLALPYCDQRYHTLDGVDRLLNGAKCLKMLVLILLFDNPDARKRQEVDSFIKGKRLADERLYGYPTLSQQVETEWFEETKGGLSVWERAIQYTEQLVRDYTKSSSNNHFTLAK